MELEVLTGEEEARLAFVGATRTLLDARRGDDRRDRRGRRLERDRHRRAGRRDGLVGLLPDRLRLPGRLVPALRPALGRGAREGAPPRGRHVRGARAAAGRQRRGRGRHGHLAAPAGGRRALPRDARARHPRALARRRSRTWPRASSSIPSACACCRPASSCSRRSPTCSGCRCGSRAAGCARACCWSWWRGGRLSCLGGLRRAIRFSSAGRSSTISSPFSIPASPPFFMPHLGAGESVHRRREVGVVAHEQHLVAQPRGERLGVERTAGELRLELGLDRRAARRRAARSRRPAPWGSSGRRRASRRAPASAPPRPATAPGPSP